MSDVDRGPQRRSAIQLPPDRLGLEQHPEMMRPGPPQPGEMYGPTPWRRRIAFADQSTLQEHVCFHADGTPASLEARVFEADGRLRPLPDGRSIRADRDTTHLIDRTTP